MIRILQLGLSGILVLALGGCGAGQSARGGSYTPPTLQDDRNALIIIYRPSQQWRANAGAYPEIFVDGQPIGVIRYKGYLAHELDPSASTLKFTGLTPGASKWKFRDRELPLNLKAGETAYYKVVVIYDESSNVLGKPGMDYTLQILPAREEDAKYELPGLSLSR